MLAPYSIVNYIRKVSYLVLVLEVPISDDILMNLCKAIAQLALRLNTKASIPVI